VIRTTQSYPPLSLSRTRRNPLSQRTVQKCVKGSIVQERCGWRHSAGHSSQYVYSIFSMEQITMLRGDTLCVHSCCRQLTTYESYNRLSDKTMTAACRRFSSAVGCNSVLSSNTQPRRFQHAHAPGPVNFAMLWYAGGHDCWHVIRAMSMFLRPSNKPIPLLPYTASVKPGEHAHFCSAKILLRSGWSELQTGQSWASLDCGTNNSRTPWAMRYSSQLSCSICSTPAFVDSATSVHILARHSRK